MKVFVPLTRKYKNENLMNKLIALSLSLAVMMGFVSCDKADDTYDTLALLPLGTFQTIYADQTVDSITVISTNNVELELKETWFSMKSGDKNITVNKMIQKKFPVFFQTNNTGSVRSGYMYAKSNGHTVAHCFLQTNWLDIVVPAAVYTLDADGLPSGASFSQTVSSSDKSTKIEFNLYSDNATLTSDAEWAVVGENDGNLDKGSHEVTITLGEHAKGATANLTLKAASGVSSVIKLVCAE